jgi:hypothetical protein
LGVQALEKLDGRPERAPALGWQRSRRFAARAIRWCLAPSARSLA